MAAIADLSRREILEPSSDLKTLNEVLQLDLIVCMKKYQVSGRHIHHSTRRVGPYSYHTEFQVGTEYSYGVVVLNGNARPNLRPPDSGGSS